MYQRNTGQKHQPLMLLIGNGNAISDSSIENDYLSGKTHKTDT
jgi:hypothetical protein